MRAIGGIHVYQHNAGQRAPELNNRPFGTVGGPYSSSVAGMHSQRPQTSRGALRLVRVFCPREPDVLVAADEGDAIVPPFPVLGSITLARAAQLLYVQNLHLTVG